MISRDFKTNFQPASWLEKLREELLGSSGGFGRKFPEGGLDFLEVALVWKFPDGSLPKQASKKFASEPPKLLRSPSRSGSIRFRPDFNRILEAQKPTPNPEIPTKTVRLRELFEKFARTFAFFPVTRVRKPTEIVQKTCSDELFYFGWIFSGGFSFSEFNRTLIGLFRA